MKYIIKNQYGETLSTHRSIEAAEKKQRKNLGYRCGICGNNKAGWGKCSHGSQNRVCSADHYGNKIVCEN